MFKTSALKPPPDWQAEASLNYEEGDGMDHTIKVLKSVSQPTRMRILLLLAEAELCSCELGGILGITQAAVSQHMNVLKRAGLVSERKSGTWVYYQLLRPSMEEALQWLNLALSSPRLATKSEPTDWHQLDRLLADREYCGETQSTDKER